MSSAPDAPAHKLPPFETLLKSRDVEDPVNLWVHRPLAYAFVWLVYRTPITPNQVTVLSLVVGCIAGGAWFVGTPRAMWIGGILLWTSAILDGADGILARAKNAASEMGRALDGAADMVVAAASVAAGFFHLWVTHESPLQVVLMPIALVTTVVQIYMYDFYKEAFMQMTNPRWNGVVERVVDAEERLARLRREGAPWTHRAAARLYVDLLKGQRGFVRLSNPGAEREPYRFRVSEESARRYRELNLGPMRVWTMLSLAPHTYVISICAMFDRLDVYLWLRAGAANVVFVVAIVWQRIASRRMREALDAMGLTPEPV